MSNMEGFYIKENGDIVINYNRIKIRNRIWVFLISECLIGGFCYWIFPDNIINFLIIFFVLGFPTLAILWSTCVDGGTKKIEKKLSFECLNSIIDKDIKAINSDIHELDRYYSRYDDDKETVRYVRVILSNGQQLQYNIRDIAEYENKNVLEIEVKYTII